ncbi:MAG: DUF3616 domain-containing protein [Rhodoferax sp.]|uniref:DUF3616 domain-containing protein n=1 Tax=Rhodoferax sp. TaxID=50421 RepID=UPI002620AC96|nr:DUF3616 domain-containing protein [Rhodoferax sp.]MDD2881357.1 DUF3616 domain-containing protein [Rhodoferax sp.]
MLTLSTFSARAQVTVPSVQSVKPSSSRWDSGAGFVFNQGKKKTLKIRQSVSGVACNLDAQGKRICLLAFDEGSQARYAYPQDGRLAVDAEIVQFAGIHGELDAEGAATDGRYVYVTGSHSAKRSDCSSNPSSRHVIRLLLDPATGRVVQGGQADTGRLWPLMQAQSALQAYVGERKCLGSEPPPKAPKLAGQQGINIEGLAVQNGRLYFGFRGPVVKGEALVLAVDADALFNGSDPHTNLTRLELGAHRGIRDMVAVSGGFLLLAGPDDDAASLATGWAVFWWDGKPVTTVAQPRLLAALELRQVKMRSCDGALKPEALTVLEESPKSYKLLVLSDGMCDGGALTFTVPKP